MKVLIADDDPISLRILERNLEKWGYEAVSAKDGEEAWAILSAEGAPSMAVLDWMMPGKDGVEVCRLLRERDREPYTYVILLTAKSRKEDIVEGLNTGADDYVTKPFDKFELEVRLRAGKRIVELQQELIESRETIRVIAMHDSLTKVYNRGAILDSLRKEFARAERKETTFGMILLDLDHFKKINDTYGHPVGDKVLQGVALNIRESIRPYDSIGRYGGEEFLMILPGCDLLTTASQAERLRMKIERSKVKSEMDDIAVTVSMGVASCRTGQYCSVEHLLVSVDEALYKAKAEGRNRVYMRDAEHSFLPFEKNTSNYEEWV